MSEVKGKSFSDLVKECIGKPVGASSFWAEAVFRALAAPSSAWLMCKNPEDAGFSKPAIQRIKDYYGRSGLASLFIISRGRRK